MTTATKTVKTAKTGKSKAKKAPVLTLPSLSEALKSAFGKLTGKVESADASAYSGRGKSAYGTKDGAPRTRVHPSNVANVLHGRKPGSLAHAILSHFVPGVSLTKGQAWEAAAVVEGTGPSGVLRECARDGYLIESNGRYSLNSAYDAAKMPRQKQTVKSGPGTVATSPAPSVKKTNKKKTK